MLDEGLGEPAVQLKGDGGSAAWTAFPNNPETGPSLVSMDQARQYFCTRRGLAGFLSLR